MRQSADAANKYAIASIKVMSNATGRCTLYLSLDRPELGDRRTYRAAVREHLRAAMPYGRLYVETPTHPIKFMRRRRRGHIHR